MYYYFLLKKDMNDNIEIPVSQLKKDVIHYRMNSMWPLHVRPAHGSLK